MSGSPKLHDPPARHAVTAQPPRREDGGGFSSHLALHPTTLPELLQDRARAAPDRPFVVTPSRTLTYAGLVAEVHGTARLLRDAGVQEGDRVAIALPNDWRFIAATFATFAIGAVAVPLDARVRPGTLADIAEDCDLHALITTPEAAERLETAAASIPVVELDQGAPAAALEDERLERPRDPDAVVSISYTSGSTGRPKGVMHSHRTWLAGAAFTADHLGLAAGDSMMIPLPLYHGYAFRHVLAYLLGGGTMVVTDGLLDALARIESDRPRGVLLVPDACRILLGSFKALLARCRPFLEHLSVGTAALPVEIWRELRDLLPEARIHLPYGLTEARVGFLRPDDDPSERRLLTTAPGMHVAVVNEAGYPVERGQSGEILIRGEGVMVGYYGTSDEERQRLRERGLRTGDEGRVTADGSIALVGRMDEVLKIGGRKIHPTEIEGVREQHPAVSESLVCAAPDPTGMSEMRLEASVVLRPGASLTVKELLTHCRAHLENHKVPAVINLVSELPKSSLGKMLRAR